MSEPIKKPKANKPESYKPEAPRLMNMLNELSSEKVVGIIVFEGLEFSIIEKAKTIYAGVYAAVDDTGWKPSSSWWGALDAGYDKEILKTIRNSVTPDCEIVLYIDYSTDARPGAMLCGQETTSREQPDGIHVIEAEPTLFIKINYTNEVFALTKKLTGKHIHQYHLLDLHELIRQIFCDGEQCSYELNASRQNGNEYMEINYFNGERYAAVPVKLKEEKAGAPIALNTQINKKPKSLHKNKPKTLAEVDAMQELPKEYEKINFGGHEWLILEKRGNKALILSETVTEYRRYHHTKIEITWADCELRGYLNNEFINTFNEDEKARIIQTKVRTCIQPWHGTDGGKDTDDHIFILSVQEAVKYFGDSGDLDYRYGWTWDGGKFVMKDGMGQLLSDRYNTARLTKDDNGNTASWHLRSPGRLNIFTACVAADGTIGMTGNAVNFDCGIRPAMWVNL